MRGCCGAGMRPSACRCARARAPIANSRNLTASTAKRTATTAAIAAAAMLAATISTSTIEKGSVGAPEWIRVAAVAEAKSQACKKRIRTE